MKTKKFLSAILSAALIFCCIPTAGAVEKVDAEKLGKTAVRTAADEWEVALSLPALEVRPSADVVIVIDVSSSMKEADIKEAKAAAAAMCDELAAKKNVDVRVGVVTFDREAQVISPLSEDLEGVKNRIEGIEVKSDTNMLAGLMAGKEMLANSTAGDQYLVLLTDGIPICWMENREVANKTWNTLSSNGEIQRTFQAGTELNQGNLSNPRSVHSAAELLSIEELFENAAAIEADSDQIYQNGETGAYMEKDGDAGAYYTNLETATYYTAKYIRDELAGDKANLITVAYGLDKYAGQGAVAYDYGEIFCDWIGRQSDQYYEVSKPGYGGEAGDLSNVFSKIADETIKLIDKGTVTDVIGEGYNLVKEEGSVPFTLTRGTGDFAVTYEGIQLENGSWGFSRNDTGYDYVARYEENSSGEETIVWSINVPVTKAEPVSLRYRVVLDDSVRSNGVHTNLDNTRGTLDTPPVFSYEEQTNDSAVLDSTDSNGNVTAEGLPFPAPYGKFETGILSVAHEYEGTVSGNPLNLPEAYASLPVITDWKQGYTAQFAGQNLHSFEEGDYSLSGIRVSFPDGTVKTYRTEQQFADEALNENGLIPAQTGLTSVVYTYSYQPTSSNPSESEGASSEPPSSEEGSSSSQDSTPATGGSGRAVLWAVVMFAALSGTAGTLVMKKRKGRQ